jgi:hypothetical protein
MRQDADKTANGRSDESPAGRATGHRYTVHEAALLVGLGGSDAMSDAVRKRSERGTLAAREGPGRYGVHRPRGRPGSGRTRDRTCSTGNESATSRELIEAPGDEVEHLRRELGMRDEELGRKDHLLAAAMERIVRLEASASQAPRDGHETTGEGAGGTERAPGRRRSRRGGRGAPFQWLVEALLRVRVRKARPPGEVHGG